MRTSRRIATWAAVLAAAALFLVPARAQTPAATTNGSITIATGNTFQQVLAALTFSSTAVTTARHSLTIENNNTNGDNCWLFIGPTASATKATSILLGQGGSYQRYSPYIPSDNIAATCTNTSDTLYVDTQ